MFLGDLINQEGQFYSYDQFRANFNIVTNFLEYNGFLTAVRYFLEVNNIHYLPEKCFNPPIPLGLAIINKDKKGCRSIYKQILGKGEYPKSLQKWKNELNNIPNSVINGSIYDLVFKTTKDPKLHWFQYRINHRILGTNYLLKKMNIVAVDTCNLCKNAPETLIHLFWHCEVSKNFWTQLINYINNKCNLNLVKWTTLDILFGSHKLDTAINTILLQAKLFLYFNKINSRTPCIDSFKKQIASRYQIERDSAVINSQLLKFEASWGDIKTQHIDLLKKCQKRIYKHKKNTLQFLSLVHSYISVGQTRLIQLENRI